MYNRHCPCKDCPDKGCGPKHSTCEKYLKFVKERNESYKRGRAIMDAADAIHDIKHNMPGYKHSVFRKKEK